jgi:hypothetical protein
MTAIIGSSHGPAPEWLGLDDWDYAAYFDPAADASSCTPIDDEVERYIEEVELEKHPFFDRAISNRSTLALWVSQELVMTNAFSQIVLSAAAQCRNVHARAVLTEIAWGEHGRMRNLVANRAHPWLLEQLRESVQLPREQIRPLDPTIAFIERLSAQVGNTLDAVAFIGVGNERLIVPEYTAVERCFEALWPESDFKPFLQANLDEDIWHSQLSYILANMLISNNAERQSFLAATQDAIGSRVRYFDELLDVDLRGGGPTV